MDVELLKLLFMYEHFDSEDSYGIYIGSEGL